MLTIWGGKDAPPTFEEQEALGVRIALIPTVAATVGLQAAWEVMNDMRARGTRAMAEWNKHAKENPWGRPDMDMLLGYSKVREIEQRYIPASLQRDYAKTWGHKVDYTTVSAAPEKRRRKA